MYFLLRIVANIFTKAPTAGLISEYEAQTTTRVMATRISVKNAMDLNEHNNNFAWASGFMLTSLLSVIVELRLETY